MGIGPNPQSPIPNPRRKLANFISKLMKNNFVEAKTPVSYMKDTAEEQSSKESPKRKQVKYRKSNSVRMVTFTNRRDYFGVPIEKGAKCHKLTFRDELGKADFLQIHKIPSNQDLKQLAVSSSVPLYIMPSQKEVSRTCCNIF